MIDRRNNGSLEPKISKDPEGRTFVNVKNNPNFFQLFLMIRATYLSQDFSVSITERGLVSC